MRQSPHGFEPGQRVLLDAHNAYPYQDRWGDRIDRALAAGVPIAIEQDLVWTGGRSIVSHGAPFTGNEPALETHFFERIRPIVEQALREGHRAAWPLITLNLDLKTDEPEHHRALWKTLRKYESWLTTAPSGTAVSPFTLAPVLVLTGSNDEQEKSFGALARESGRLLLFGAARMANGEPEARTNYRRWWNLPWKAVEPEGQPAAGEWTHDDDSRLRAIVKRAHERNLWIRFYTLNGHDRADESGGWSPGYNFGSIDASRLRWDAAIRARVDFIATDQYEEFAQRLDARTSAMTITGTITRADYERLIEREFEVAPGTDSIEVTLSYSGEERRTVIDLGLRGPRGFRGWSGGGPQTIVTGQTFASYGYLPGAIEPGTWAVVLGIPNIREGSRDAYSLEIRQFARERPRFLPVRDDPGWYAGDFHSHSGHSDGRTLSASGARLKVPPHRVFDAARAAELDFVALTDHNTSSHWTDVDRLQPFYESLLLLHAREVTTYNGHVNAFGETRFVDFRLSPDRPMRSLAGDLRRAGALISVNHPAAPDDERCMGCGWSSMDRETLALIDAVEIVNGPAAEGPLGGWKFWADLLNRGFRPAPIGGSDEHTPEETADRAIGTPTTVVFAQSLSEQALLEGVQAGRVYVRTRGVKGPQLDFEASAGGKRWAMGSAVPGGGEMTLRATLRAAEGQQLIWIRRGQEIGRATVRVGVVAEIVVDAKQGDWFSIIVRDSEGPTLYSGAIFVSDAVLP